MHLVQVRGRTHSTLHGGTLGTWPAAGGASSWASRPSAPAVRSRGWAASWTSAPRCAPCAAWRSTTCSCTSGSGVRGPREAALTDCRRRVDAFKRARPDVEVVVFHGHGEERQLLMTNLSPSSPGFWQSYVNTTCFPMELRRCVRILESCCLTFIICALAREACGSVSAEELRSCSMLLAIMVEVKIR